MGTKSKTFTAKVGMSGRVYIECHDKKAASHVHELFNPIGMALRSREDAQSLIDAIAEALEIKQ